MAHSTISHGELGGCSRTGGYVAAMLPAVRRNPSAILLFVQLGGVLLYPFMEGSDAGRAIFSAFGIVVLALAVLAVRATPTLTWVSLLFALPATVLLVIQAVGDHDELLPYSSALEAVLYFYAAWALVRYMLADHVITTERANAFTGTTSLSPVLVSVVKLRKSSSTHVRASRGSTAAVKLLGSIACTTW